MAEGNVFLNLAAKDNASSTIRAVADTARQSMQDMLKHNKRLAGSTTNVAKAKQLELTLSQKMRFAIAKETAKGNKLNTTIVKRQIALAKMERRLRTAIKAGDWNAQILAKQTVQLRKNVVALQAKSKKLADAAIPMGVWVKWLKRAAIAGAALGAGIVAIGIKVGTFGDSMIKGAQRLGLTTDEFQELDYAMKISGTSMDKQKSSLVRFARTARDAATGVKIAEESFFALGVSAKNANGEYKGTAELLKEVSDKFRQMPPTAEKTALSMDLFGRAGSELAQFLNLGSYEMKRLGEEAHRLGGVMSEDAAKKAEKLIDALTRMVTAAKGVMRTFGEKIGPGLTLVMSEIAESIVNLRRTFVPIFKDFVSYAKDTATLLVPVGSVIGKVFIGIMTTAGKAWDSLILGWNVVLAGLVGISNKLVDLFNYFSDDAEPKLVHFDNVFLTTAENMAANFGKSAEAAAALFKEIDRLAGILDGSIERQDRVIDKTNEQTEAWVRQKQTLAELRAAQAAYEKEQQKAIDDKAKREQKFQEDFDKGLKKGTKIGNKFADDQERLAEQTQDKWARASLSVGNNLARAFAAGESAQEKFKNVYMEAAAMYLDVGRDMAVKAIMRHAGTAAAGAAESQSSIPYVGPFLAAAAAATMFTLVSGFLRGLNKGGIVPGVGDTDTVPALLTPGEIVLPKRLSNMLLNVAGKQGGYALQGGGRVAHSGRGVTVNFNSQSMFERSPAELDRLLRDKLLPSLKRLRRRGVAV